ncbi:Protein SEY1 [Bienertia sinuspersici]
MKEHEGGGENFKRNFVYGCFNVDKRESKGDAKLQASEMSWRVVIYGPSLLYGRVMDRQFPLIKCWKRENIFNRRDLELKKAGGQHVRYQQEIPTETIEHAKKACIEKVTQIAKELAKSFSEFVDAMDEAKMKFPDREPIVKLCDLASSIVQVFEDSEFKECTQRGEARTHCSDGSPRLDENDEIFNDPSFLKAVEFMEKSFTKKPSSCTFDAPSFDLGVDFSQE